ncbi:MAG: H(+)/Cl(-) exchange transporter ClcA [Marinibacterium sp.]|nr:H(+)/Cl(-) exchange transporter ClcA [Marinibacterium sp.]
MQPPRQRSFAVTREMSALALLAMLAGAAAGAIGAGFRLALDWGDRLRGALVGYADADPVLGVLALMLGAGAAAAFAAWLVRRFAPAAEGSGIPHVEAALAGDISPTPARLIPIKFVGGVAAMSGGLALGREGPSVQMGASMANLIGRIFRRNWRDRRALIAGGAGAGLATAFSAPGAGAIFVLEELVGRFDPRMALVALGASAGAIIVSRSLLGTELVFEVSGLTQGGLAAQIAFLMLGLFAGLLSIVYNRSLEWTLSLADRIGGPVELRAAVIGALVGLLAWVVPDLVGSGEAIAQSGLSVEMALTLLPAIFLFRLALGALSYAAATPGGLFAPLLALGAIAGLGFGHVALMVVPDVGVDPASFALVGMGALFAGVVRAPLTGIVLVTEMTGSSQGLLPLLSGCFGAMLAAETLGERPVYEILKQRSALKKR